MQRPKQPQKINFSALKPDVLDTLTPQHLADLTTFRNYFITQSLRMPAGATRRDNLPAIDANVDIPKLDIFIKFLNFCRKHPKAQAARILKWLNRTALKQKEPTFDSVTIGNEAFGQIIGFCRGHQDLSAEQILAGSTQNIPLEKIQEDLKSIRAIEKFNAQSKK